MSRLAPPLAALSALALAACADEPRRAASDATTPAPDTLADIADASDTTAPEIADTAAPEIDFSAPITIEVLLDGAPVAGARVTQGGSTRHALTGPDGRLVTTLDPRVEGELAFIASHPEARIKAAQWRPGLNALTIELSRYDPADNPAYRFQDPGEPSRRDNTAQCAHCHVTINADWFESPHRSAASNPRLHDLYLGTAQALSDVASCTAQGGRWIAPAADAPGKSPGTCLVGDGALAHLNPGVCADATCTTPPADTGACADCHAPGIDGDQGARDLRDAEGHAKDYGVHCDVCHKVAAVDLGAPEPGVGGRLILHRPSEPSPSIGLGQFLPLTFGPHHDVPNPRMGLVQREHFKEATLCAGCHQYEQPAPASDPTRWPDGRLPIHSTHAEWLASDKHPDTPCQRCHMPPDLTVENGADLQLFGGAAAGGIAAGWRRPPGAVMRHTFGGPRTPQSELLQDAAALDVSHTLADGVVTATVTVENALAGHAIPTGEPLRSLVLLVSARCGHNELEAIGGDVVPDFGGALAEKHAGEDWSRWPRARPGQVIRVITRGPEHRDYRGFGPFSDGRFTPADKGMPRESARGQATIIAVDPDGTVTLDRPLPDGDLAYLGDGAGLPADGDAATYRAGAPGFAFARVLVAADGRRMVPHFLAIDVASDNRILPRERVTTEHRFRATCEDPEVHAALMHRAYPPWLAAERGWALGESLMRSAVSPP